MYGLTFEEKVLEEINNLRDRLERLENKPDWSTPMGPIPTWGVPTPFPNISDWNPKCSKCGLIMNGPMGYCCPHKDCPCGMGPVWSGVTELK